MAGIERPKGEYFWAIRRVFSRGAIDIPPPIDSAPVRTSRPWLNQDQASIGCGEAHGVADQPKLKAPLQTTRYR